MIFVGDDWAEDHHDVFVMDESGGRLGDGRLPEGVEGIARFHDLMGGLVDDPAGVVVGIETDRGLWVGALVAAGYQVYAVNPKAAARYRDRHHLSGAKSDRADAKLLADLVRTDRHNHRPVAGDSPQAEGIKQLARTHQTLIWERRRHANRLRSTLREYYPAAVNAFDDLTSPDALAVLAAAPTPRQGTALDPTELRELLTGAGRRRLVDTRAAHIHAALGVTHLRAPDPVEDSYGVTVTVLVAVIAELNRQISRLETELRDRFDGHPDAGIYLSLPGLGVTLSVRVLGEFGDDPHRYPDVKSRRNYAGTSPVTIASGRSHTVAARWIRNNRLYDPLIRWAFCSLTHSPGCRAYYDTRRAAGDSHYQALRALANRLVGILHGCLTHHTPYNEHTAWNHRTPTAA